MLNNLKTLGTSISLNKGEHLFRQGDDDTHLYILNSGILKAYYITYNGKESVKSFISEGGYIASLQSLLGAGGCSFNVVALEPCQAIKVAGSALTSLSHQNPEQLQTINTALLALAQKKEQREYEFLCLSAQERYLRFCDEQAPLLGRIAQHDIAKYLGITSVALSRIRKRINDAI